VNDVIEQLRRLRQEAGLTLPPHRIAPALGTAVVDGNCPGSKPDSVPGSVPAHIRRLLGVRGKSLAPRPLSCDRQVPGVEIAVGLRFTEQRFAWADAPAEIDAGFARLGTLRRDHLLHFDTETTGLAGGTGTRAFMIGAADWSDGGLRLRQLTMTTMAAETAMLRTFAQWLAPDTVLVSYNGKCYDAPLLNTRYRLARMQSPLPGLRHLDLLHPARRRWKGQWENCRLGTIERQVLGIVRDDDLPGSEAPRAWLDYLRGGSARDLRRVAEHNAQDLRSLAGLCLHMASLEAGCEPPRSAAAPAQPKRPVM